jgi:prefoldin subunit 5
MSLWDSSAVVRRIILAPYYRRKATLEAARLLKIRLALDAKINFVRSHWEQLQKELSQAKTEFAAEPVNFDFTKKLDEFRTRCQETVPNLIVNERWDEAGPLLQGLMEELQVLRARRAEFKAKIPKLKASWQRIQETAHRLGAAERGGGRSQKAES